MGMRPKLFALIAVSAVALVGCSAGEPVVRPAKPVVQPTKSAPGGPPLAPETGDTPPVPATAKAEDAIDPRVAIEEGFADFAETRAVVQGASKPSRSEVIKALNEFCESGKAFDISATKDLNENLDIIAEKSACADLAAN